jgi:PIN domain nuclease of toxin-antitoxin system
MGILLDTCAFLWVILGARELSSRAKDLFTDPSNDVFLSAVSVWEISVKYSLGRLPLYEPPERFLSQERERHLIAPLPLDEADVLHLHRLPQLHKDPFDRMLVCQAIERGLVILTPDRLISQYPTRTAW